LIGSNDACSEATATGLPVDIMRAHLWATLEKLNSIEQPEPIRVLLVGIPRIPDLGTPAFRNTKTVFGLKCETVRNEILHFCDPLLTWSSPQEYGQKMQIIEERNLLFRNLKKEWNASHPHLQLAYSNRLYQLPIPIELLAADCFHPGSTAQEAISRETWEDQPWFR
jgi:hypothetical protein